MAEEKPCPFCAPDTEKNRILHQTRLSLVILSNPCLMLGHTLIIPRRHVGAPFELLTPEREEIFHLACRFQQKIMKVFSGLHKKIFGCDITMHTRPFMSQTELSIPGHVHAHLRPRFLNDPLYEKIQHLETPMFHYLEDVERQWYQELLAE